MPDEPTEGALFEDPRVPEGTVVVNDRCVVRTREGHRVVIVAGVSLASYAVGDRMSEAHAIASLVEQGWASQVEVARAFGCASRTVRRLLRRFEEHGLVGLGRGGGFPKGHARLGAGRVRLVQQMKAQGESNCSIAARLHVTENAVRKLVCRLGWTKPSAEQQTLPGFEEGAHPSLSGSDDDAPLPTTSDRDPADRTGDRLDAYLGMLVDAAPLFRPGTRVPRAGVLLAIPAILRTGVLRSARKVYGSIGPAFYGLRTAILALVLLALLRIKRPEALKEHAPADLGRILGLDRAPEVKTVRRKLTRLTNLVKMIAYQVESDLVHAIAPHYRRSDDEGRTLIQTVLASAAGHPSLVRADRWTRSVDSSLAERHRRSAHDGRGGRPTLRVRGEPDRLVRAGPGGGGRAASRSRRRAPAPLGRRPGPASA